MHIRMNGSAHGVSIFLKRNSRVDGDGSPATPVKGAAAKPSFLYGTVMIEMGGLGVRKWMSIVLVVILMAAAGYYFNAVRSPQPQSQSRQTETQQPSPPRQETVTLIAAGDCLMHNTQIWSGQQGDHYNFDSFFASVKPYLEEGDLATVCFEAPMAGPQNGYTGYPLFNSPDEAADAFKKAGFDIVVTAHNHCLDRGIDGLRRTLDVLHGRGLDTLGTYASSEESRRFLIKEVRGVKIGYLAYTYGTNGIPVPAQKTYSVNYIYPDRIIQDINALRPQTDILVLVLHWGVEYTAKPTMEQKILAQRFMEAGADVILGSHPHVIQTMEMKQVKGKNRFVIYAMGNFIGDQNGMERNSGIILRMNFRKDFAANDTRLESVSYTPTYSHSYKQDGREKFRVIPIEETILRIENGQEKILQAADLITLKNVLGDTQGRLGFSLPSGSIP